MKHLDVVTENSQRENTDVAILLNTREELKKSCLKMIPFFWEIIIYFKMREDLLP